MDTDNGKILFVDDEFNILKALKRTLLNSNYELFVASSGADGLKILANEDIDLVVSDMKMPEMNGYEFLCIVKEKYPKVIRAMLSGYVEQTHVLKALKEGVANTYFAKPWDDDSLKEGIGKMVKMRKKLNNSKLLELVDSMSNLPSLPSIYNEFIDAVEKEAAFDILENIISKDITISTKILHIVNSIFYGSNKTASISQSLVMLGVNAVKDIVLTVSILKNSNFSKWQIEQFDFILKHSSIVNKYINIFYKEVKGVQIPGNFSSVGITHDIGKVLLLQHFPERYKLTFDNMLQKKLYNFYESELDLGYGDITHSEIGAYLLDLWNFPDASIQSALYHHNIHANKIDDTNIYHIVYYVNSLVDLIERDVSADPFQSDFIQSLELNHDFLVTTVEDLKNDFKNYI